MKMVKEEYKKLDSGLILQEKMLNLIGIWPSNVNSFASVGRFLLTIAINISYLCSLLVEIYRQCVSVDDLMDALILAIVGFSLLLKLLINRMNWKHMYVLINSVTEDWSTVRDSRHKRIMTKYFQRGRIVSLTLLYMCYVAGPTLVIKNNSFDQLLKRQVTKYLMDSTESSNDTWTLNHMTPTTCVYGVMPLYLKTGVIILQLIQVAAVSFSQCGMDGCFFTLTMHLSGQFEILQMNLEEIKFEEIGSRKTLGLLVARHSRLVLLADNLNQGFSMMVLLQLLASTLVLCIEGFVLLVSLEENDILGTFKSVLLILMIIIELYLYAYAGDILESQAGDVANAAYKSSWYLERGNAARDVAMIIRRGQLSCKLTAGKFGPLNRFTFKESIKASASYLSVLRVMMQT